MAELFVTDRPASSTDRGAEPAPVIGEMAMMTNEPAA